MFAIVKIGSSQHIVSVGSDLLVDFQDTEKTSLKFDQVLLISDGDKINLGKPIVSGASVEAKLISNPKGEKVHVGKFKAKSRYRKFIGFRHQYTRIQVTGIHTANSVKET